MNDDLNDDPNDRPSDGTDDTDDADRAAKSASTPRRQQTARTFGRQAAYAGMGYGLGVLCALIVPGFLLWVDFRAGGAPDLATLGHVAVFVAIGLGFGWLGWRSDRSGLEIAERGFRMLGQTEWTPWPQLHSLRFHRFRQRVTLHDDTGRTLGQLSYFAPDLIAAIARILDARPEAARPLPLPATVRASRLQFAVWLFEVVLIAGCAAAVGVGIAYSDFGGADGTLIAAVAGLAVAAVMTPSLLHRLRRLPIQTTIDRDGIDVRCGWGAWQAGWADVARVQFVTTSRAWDEAGQITFEVRLLDHAGKERTIVPYGVDPLVVWATVDPLVKARGA